MNVLKTAIRPKRTLFEFDNVGPIELENERGETIAAFATAIVVFIPQDTGGKDCYQATVYFRDDLGKERHDVLTAHRWRNMGPPSQTKATRLLDSAIHQNQVLQRQDRPTRKAK